MFTTGLSVQVKHLELTRTGPNIVAFFQQDFTTPAFRDSGRKLLAFARLAEGWRIAREEMLSSEVQGGGGSVASLPGFFFARPDGVVLRSAIDERWLSPARRELSRKFRKAREEPNEQEPVDDDFLRPGEVTLPPEVTAFEGKTLYVSRAPAPGSPELPAPCQVKVQKLTLRNVAAPSFEGVRSAMGYDHVFSTVVLGQFDQACPGALWASETPPSPQRLPTAADREAHEAARQASKLMGDEVVPRLLFDADGDGQLEILTAPQGTFATVLVLQMRGGKLVATPVYSEPDFVCPG